MTLRQQAEAIWKAGVAAVDSAALVSSVTARRSSAIDVCGETFDLEAINRIVVVGAGKAGAGMAAGVESAIGPDLESKLIGWVNVPSDCVRPLQRIHLHAARPAGANEPTAEGVVGSERILELVSSLTDHDLCLVLISGGGSALLPAPIAGISLNDKLCVTRSLMKSGATIQELNTVRKRLSRIKGGGLLRSAKAGRMIAMIISDVVGDPLDIIASGPTVCDGGTANDALTVLERFFGRNASNDVVPNAVWRLLEDQAKSSSERERPTISCHNRVIGNNLTALDAAATKAKEIEFDVRILGTNRQGIARDIGIELAERCLGALNENSSKGICFLGGGEPIVKLAITEKPRRGGRNQEVALAAGVRWGDQNISRLAVLSAGTDGEDGPTDAAGACFDATTQQSVQDLGLVPSDFLAINDSYTLFERAGGLFKTGPTHTNVMDLQIALVAGAQSSSSS